jgi:phospholipid/cholesterol/gamma-HCH transport system substrate-binding protein
LETRSHIFLVTTVVLSVFAALVGFIMWITPDDPSRGRQYDILFDQSVSGLAEGSSVTFAGIPVGRVQSVALEPGNPDLVRVRIAIVKDEEDLPIVEGTTATLNGDLAFGTALIDLRPADGPGRPVPLDHNGVGMLPAKSSGFGGLTNDPGPMLDRISRGTDMLLDMTSPEGQREFAARLQASERMTKDLARRSADLGTAIAQARSTVRATTVTATDYAKRADAMEAKVRTQGAASLKGLRQASAAGREALRGLDAKLEAAGPQVQGLSATAADLGTQMQELRTTVSSARDGIERIEEGGLGAGAAEPALPHYKPRN